MLDGRAIKLKTQLQKLYEKRRKIRKLELEEYKEGQGQTNDLQQPSNTQGDWRRDFFSRVVGHMVPERDRLAQSLMEAAPLRSPIGISALKDLITLLTSDSRVAYQETLRPIGGQCPVPSCSKDIARYAVLHTLEDI